MLIRTEDGKFLTGPQDRVLILHHVSEGTYHCTFFEEYPFPGRADFKDIVRVKSKMAHTLGSLTLDGAKKHVEELRAQVIVADAQVHLEPIAWDGNPGVVLLVPFVHPIPEANQSLEA